MLVRPDDSSLPSHWDVVVIGAGLAGVSLASLLRRGLPRARVLIVDERERPTESSPTTPFSAHTSSFFDQALGARELLVQGHLPATGTRIWFACDERAELGDLDTLGLGPSSACSAHHVDRARLALALERRSQDEGVRILRGARVERAELGWPESNLHLTRSGRHEQLHARWVIDASGESAFLARALSLQQYLAGPRMWSAAANWIGMAEPRPRPAEPRHKQSPRSFLLATHHFCGEGWLVRVCPHPLGGSSVRLLAIEQPPVSAQGPGSLERYSRRVRGAPGLRELLRRASVEPDSFRARTLEEWTVTRRCARGWWLIGGASGALAGGFGCEQERLVHDLASASRVILGDLTGERSEQATLEDLSDHEDRCRVRDAALASESLPSAAALFVDPLSCATFLRLRHLREHGDLRPASRALLQQGPGALERPWPAAVYRAWVGRLRRVSAARRAAGLVHPREGSGSPRSRPAESDSACLRRAAQGWARAEYSLLREAMRPVAGDVKAPHGPEIQRRAAQALEQARGLGLKEPRDEDQSGDLQ